MTNLFGQVNAQDRLHRLGAFDYLDRYPFMERTRLVSAVAEAHLGSDLNVLDIGGGHGTAFGALASLVRRYTYTDISPLAAAAFVERFGQTNGFDTVADVLVGNVADLSLPEEQHLVLCLGVCRGLYAADQFARLFERNMCADGGLLILEGAVLETREVDAYLPALPEPLVVFSYDLPATGDIGRAPVRRTMTVHSRIRRDPAAIESTLRAACEAAWKGSTSTPSNAPQTPC